MKNFKLSRNPFITLAATLCVASLMEARAHDLQDRQGVAPIQTFIDEDPNSAPPVASAPPARPAPPVTIETVEPYVEDQSKPVTWLGVAVEESSEALSAQLGLKPGEGLTVTIIAPDSPASKAEFRKNDVLAELDGQMLVHPIQLRKLVQMHGEGDTVQLVFFRGGKKQTTSVKLGKTTWTERAATENVSWSSYPHNYQFQFNGLDGLNNLNGQLRTLKGQLPEIGQPVSRLGLDKDKLDLEIKRTMEQTRKAIQDAVQHASSERQSLRTLDRQLDTLAREGVDVDKDATVIIRNKRNTNKTLIQTDDSGSYVIEVGAKTHLIVHDKDGKLLFEGEIDTAAEREKVPKDVWEKVAPMLDQMNLPKDGKSKTEGRLRKKTALMKQIVCQCVLPECSM